MDKRYQVFVSSTYADLKEERDRVFQTLMEMDCIPAGMELFPAMDEEQFEFIKRVIDDCDYYILIIGGRYGSVTPEGISYTEKEYDYAIERGLKVLAFIHEKPEDIPVGKSESDPQLRSRLVAFREKVSKGRLVKFWKIAEELPGLVSTSLNKTIKTYPAIGWVRTNQVSSAEILGELNELRKRNKELEETVSKTTINPLEPKIDNLAALDEKVEISGTHWMNNQRRYWEKNLSWVEVFGLIAPYLLQPQVDQYVRGILLASLEPEGDTPILNDQIFQTVKIQLIALGLIEVQYAGTTQGGMALFWKLTQKGHELMMQVRTIKSPKN
jgi:hypothetical protein